MTTAPKRGRGRPRLPPTVRIDLHVPRALGEALAAAATARRTTVTEVCRERLEAADGEDARRSAYLAGYRAGVREAAARVEALGREAPQEVT